MSDDTETALKVLRALKQQYDPDSDEYADISQTIYYLKSE